MDQPTGEPAAKNRTPMFIGIGVVAALVIGGGLYLESAGEVGKMEAIKQVKTEDGDLRGRIMRDLIELEGQLKQQPDANARSIQARVVNIRQAAIAATTAAELMKVDADLQSIKTLFKQ